MLAVYSAGTILQNKCYVKYARIRVFSDPYFSMFYVVKNKLTRIRSMLRLYRNANVNANMQY